LAITLKPIKGSKDLDFSLLCTKFGEIFPLADGAQGQITSGKKV